MMSAPASRYCAWMPAIDVGPGQDEQVVVALEIVRVRGEALAAEVGFREAAGAGPSCPWRRRGRGCGAARAAAMIAVSAGRVIGSHQERAFRRRGLVPAATSTTNGSPAVRAPTRTRTSVRPAPASSACRSSFGKALPAVAERVAHPALVVRPQVEHEHATALASGRAPLRRRRAPARAAWCSACDSSATSTLASSSGSRSSSPRFQVTLRDVPPRRAAPWRGPSTSAERSTATTLRAQCAASSDR